jgi:hypothetical protein
VRGELDWIVMKVLEKDRNRRYETASGLAADVRRYLDDEPVQACPPSAWYRLSKAAHRNRAALVTAALVATALVLGTAMSTWQARKAQTEASISKAINDFLLNDLVAEAAPEKNSRGERMTVEALLNQAAARLQGKFAGQPSTRSTIEPTKPRRRAIKPKTAGTEMTGGAAPRRKLTANPDRRWNS